jgi:hypothetical protein
LLRLRRAWIAPQENDMTGALESELAANLVMVAAFCSMTLGCVMILAGLKVRRQLARERISAPRRR